jgi:hypothetical protein
LLISKTKAVADATAFTFAVKRFAKSEFEGGGTIMRHPERSK